MIHKKMPHNILTSQQWGCINELCRFFFNKLFIQKYCHLESNITVCYGHGHSYTKNSCNSNVATKSVQMQVWNNLKSTNYHNVLLHTMKWITLMLHCMRRKSLAFQLVTPVL